MVVFAKLSDSLTKSLSKMPSISHHPVNRVDTYLLPPVKYPDGSTYVKIGVHNSERILKSDREIREWFRNGTDEQEKEIAYQSIIELITNCYRFTVMSDTTNVTSIQQYLKYYDHGSVNNIKPEEPTDSKE